MDQSVGHFIKKKRKEQNMTLQQLAEATGLSVGYLSLMERGLNSPTIANLHKVCRAIHTTMIELFSDIESGKLLVRNGERQVFFEEPGKLRYEKMIDGNRLLVSTSVSVMDDEEHAFDRHITDEFGIVFRGSLEVTGREHGVSDAGRGFHLYSGGEQPQLPAAERWRMYCRVDQSQQPIRQEDRRRRWPPPFFRDQEETARDFPGEMKT